MVLKNRASGGWGKGGGGDVGARRTSLNHKRTHQEQFNDTAVALYTAGFVSWFHSLVCLFISVCFLGSVPDVSRQPPAISFVHWGFPKNKNKKKHMLPCLPRYSHATLYMTSHPLSPHHHSFLNHLLVVNTVKCILISLKCFFFFFFMSVPTNKHSAGFKGVCGGWKWLFKV